MSPKEVILNWIEAFNKKDSEALADLYSETAVNHQVVNDPVIGKDAIKKMFAGEFNKTEMVCIPEKIFQDGEWAILEWKDPMGLRGCGFFHIVDDKIIFQRGYWDKLSFLRIHNLPLD